MTNVKLLRFIYDEIKQDFCGIKYLSDNSPYTKPHIWSTMRLLKAMDLVSETYSNQKANVRVYKLKVEMDFSKFLEIYLERS